MSQLHSVRPASSRGAQAAVAALLVVLSVAGCPAPPLEVNNPPGFENTTDPTNGNARYVGSSSCIQCHSSVGDVVEQHGHFWAMSKIEGRPPEFPDRGFGDAIEPPAGFAWTDIPYLVGGYRKSAIFLDANGRFITTGSTGAAAQWNPTQPPIGITSGLSDFQPATADRPTFDFVHFQHLTSGARDFAVTGLRQDNRPGIGGTWAETGVRCESCHGPGGNHFTTLFSRTVIDTAAVYVDPTGNATCRSCHSHPLGTTARTILADSGYVRPFQQSTEMYASGGHANFQCTFCHDPHYSIATDRARAIRNECQACHADVSPAAHIGKTYRRASDGYTETITCESCHMPYAVQTVSTAPVGLAGPQGRIGDTRSHIFRIRTEPGDFTQFLADDGAAVRLDSAGRAAISVDFVCLRCHNGNGLFSLSVDRAAEIAPNVHLLP